MLDAQNTCLVIIDVQGKLAQLMDDKVNLFRNLSILTQSFKLLDIPVLLCRQNPRALGETIPEIKDFLTDEQPVDKMAFSCCGDPEFLEKLKGCGRTQFVLCGIEAHICVYQTAMDLLEMDYEVYVVADAVSSRTPRNREIALDRMALEGVKRASTEMLLFELLGSAEHKHFKAIARLVK
jgi:nicotinamidase-related amidase